MSGEHYFDLPIIGKYLKKVIINKEGGEKLSLTLRSYVSEKYKVNVGKYTLRFGFFTSDFNIWWILLLTWDNIVHLHLMLIIMVQITLITDFSMSPYFYNKCLVLMLKM
mgnify:CR=1 FL=1